MFDDWGKRMNPQALRMLALNYRATDGIRNSQIGKDKK
nr:MAG TPA: hypothetical protein [Caudoviricetes sp.]